MPEQYQPIAAYDALRRRLEGQYNQQRQEAGDALKRRAAAQGMLGSGAFAKREQIQNQEIARQQADATAQVDFAEANEAQRRKEVVEQRQFQTGERLGAQQFASGERVASQVFNKQLFDEDMKFKDRVFTEENKLKWKELDESIAANRINEAVALKEADMNADEVNWARQQGDAIRGGYKVTNSKPLNAMQQVTWAYLRRLNGDK